MTTRAPGFGSTGTSWGMREFERRRDAGQLPASGSGSSGGGSTSGGGGSTSQPAGTTTPAPPRKQTIRQAMAALQSQYPWLPTAVLEVLAEGYVEHGDAHRALNEFRQSDDYDEFYPGNRRADGTLRYDEAGHYAYRERARATIRSLNLNPAIFENQIVESLSRDVGIDELEARIDGIYERVLDAIPQVGQRFLADDGRPITLEHMVAVALDPDINTAVLEGRIVEAEIGAAADVSGFGARVQGEFLRRLRTEGGLADFAQAREFFGEGSEQVRIIDTLLARHNDPDDDFDIEDFASATLFFDPGVRRRMRNALIAERTSFSNTRFAQSRESAGLSGLIQS